MNQPEYTATAEEIASSTDAKQLIEWYDHADDMATNLEATILARNASDVPDDDAWFFRASDKYAHCRTAMKRCLRQLHRIGYEGRVEVTSVAVEEMKGMKRAINALQNRVNRLDGGKND